MAVVVWRPQTVLGPVARAFPPSVAKAAGIARAKAPIRTGELRRSIRHQVTAGLSLSGAIVAQSKHAAAQEFGAKPHIIAPREGGVLASSAPTYTRGPSLPGKRSQRQNFFARGPVHHPGNAGRNFVRLGAAAWRLLYIMELRRKL